MESSPEHASNPAKLEDGVQANTAQRPAEELIHVMKRRRADSDEAREKDRTPKHAADRPGLSPRQGEEGAQAPDPHDEDEADEGNLDGTSNVVPTLVMSHDTSELAQSGLKVELFVEPKGEHDDCTSDPQGAQPGGGRDSSELLAAREERHEKGVPPIANAGSDFATGRFFPVTLGSVHGDSSCGSPANDTGHDIREDSQPAEERRIPDARTPGADPPGIPVAQDHGAEAIKSGASSEERVRSVEKDKTWQ